MEAAWQIEAKGKSAAVIADEIRQKLGRATETGCVLILQGLSGTGKGTTIKKLHESLRRSACWSNGNVFRALTLLALKHCQTEQEAFKPEKLTNAQLQALMSCLEVENFKGGFDIKIKGLGQDVFFSEIKDTLLMEPEVARAVPAVAEKAQGEVIKFAAEAAQLMQAAGMTVLMEGRSQSLDYVRTPYRFELVLNNPIAIGERRAAQRLLGAARDELLHEPLAADAALLSALRRLCEEAGMCENTSCQTLNNFPQHLLGLRGMGSFHTSPVCDMHPGAREKLGSFVSSHGTGPNGRFRFPSVVSTWRVCGGGRDGPQIAP